MALIDGQECSIAGGRRRLCSFDPPVVFVFAAVEVAKAFTVDRFSNNHPDLSMMLLVLWPQSHRRQASSHQIVRLAAQVIT